MFFLKDRTNSLVVLMLGLFSLKALATVQVTPLRPMIVDSKKETTIVVENKGNAIALVQVWPTFHETLGGYEKDNNRPQFVVSPPMFKLEPSKKQKVRLIYTGPELKSERLYRLNVQEIPPVNDSENGVQFAFRHVMPLSIRTNNMNDKDMEGKASQLGWHAKGDKLSVVNNSDYVFILSAISVNGKKVALGETNQLSINPAGTVDLNVAINKGDKIDFSWFNGAHVIKQGQSKAS